MVMFDHPLGRNPMIDGFAKSSRSLSDLHSVFRPIVLELIARAVEKNLKPKIIETRRSISQHRENVKNGKSFTADKLSWHCFGLAIDIAPENVLTLENWGPEREEWQALGEIGKSLGLGWGGLWKQRDMVHFEASPLLRSSIDMGSIVLWG